MLKSKDHCAYCHVLFALAEEKVWFDSKPYHEDCNNRRERKTRIREFILRHAVEKGLVVTPHGVTIKRGS